MKYPIVAFSIEAEETELDITAGADQFRRYIYTQHDTIASYTVEIEGEGLFQSRRFYLPREARNEIQAILERYIGNEPTAS